jgi:hypothetical protein
VKQQLLTFLEHLSSPPVFSWVRVTRSLVLCVCFVDRCLSFCTFRVGHCVVCSSIYRFWLSLWYLQTILTYISSHNLFKILTSLPLVNIMLAIKLSSDFLQGSNIKYLQIVRKLYYFFSCPFLLLNHIAGCSGKKSYRKRYKAYYLRIQSGMCEIIFKI